ncbi:MAG: hypothetical protein IPK33_11430 [Gemmatimonadetes bacterium]|nr:hypothetical protein [Gemmatimonadota bacterium]
MWVSGDGGDPIPKDAFSFRGAGGQARSSSPTATWWWCDWEVRRARTGDATLKDGLALLMEAVPPKGASTP